MAPEVLSDQARQISQDGDAGISADLPGGNRVVLPSTSAGLITLGRPGPDQVSVRLPYGSSLSRGQQIDHAVVAYRTGNETVTSATLKDDGSVQIATVIEGPRSPSRYRYELGIPGDATSVVESDGSVFFLRSDGSIALGMARPWARDAGGRELQTYYEVDGNSVTQVVDHRGAGSVEYPVVADPWMGTDLFSYTGYDRKGPYKNQVVVSAKLGAWGWGVYVGIGGQWILDSAGWSELLKKRPRVGEKSTLRQQYTCHVSYGYAVWLAGLHWDLEKARANKSDWALSALQHKCNW